LTFAQPVRLNFVRLREAIRLGQRVDDWALDAWQDGIWKEFAQGTAIGVCRLVRTNTITTDRVRLRITKLTACPAIAEFGLFAEPERLPKE
jgi:alpha-L-fucosidase